jgi:hypothetical protein
MKVILYILSLIISSTLVGQTYDLNECPLYSKIWVSNQVDNGDGIKTEVLPKNSKTFGLNTNFIQQNIDVNKIQSYLLTAFNEFRKDYKCVLVSEDTLLTKQSINYSKIVAINYGHDNTLPSNQSECLAGLPFILFTKVTKEDGDFNKIVAESCFDVFVGCPAHMSALLDNRIKDYGFGVTINKGCIYIIIRGKLKD